MAKLSDNQQAAMAGLHKALADGGADYVTPTQWKKYVEAGTTVSVKSLVSAGAVVEIKVLAGKSPAKAYRPADLAA